MKAAPIILASVVLLAGCGGNDSTAEQSADRLEEAAEVSNPAAAEVLEDSADQIREADIQGPAAAQQALEAAGNAQVAGQPTGDSAATGEATSGAGGNSQ